MEEEYEDDPMLDDESGSDEEMDDSIQIDARELQQALLDEEQNGSSLDEIKELWTLSAQNAITKPDEGVSLFTTYIYLLRRMGTGIDELKTVFLEGKDFLMERFKSNWDNDAKYRRNFAYFLYTKAKQPEEALKLWKDILATWDVDSYMWIEASNLERIFGEVDNARTLLYKAINAQLTEPYALFEYFVQFEREEGTRQQVDIALQKINAYASRLAKSKPQKVGNKDRGKKDSGKADDHKRKVDTQPDDRKRKSDTQPEADKFKKIVKVSDDVKQNGNVSTIDKPAKKDADGFAIPTIPSKTIKPKVPEATAEKPIGPLIPPSASTTKQEPKETEKTEPENPDLTVFLSNIPFQWTADDVRQRFPTATEIRIPHKTKGLNKGFAFVDFGCLEDTNDALKLDGKLQADGRNIQIFSYKNHQADQKPEFKFATSVEKNKLFVRNVEFKSTEDELRQLFGQHGELKDVRIVRHKNGKPKGVAFIEFQNEESAQNALALNEYVFNGRTLEVHISDPSQARRRDPVDKPTNSNFESKSMLGGGQSRSRTTGFSLKPRVLLDK